MIVWVLDTDIVTLCLSANPVVVQRVGSVSPHQLAVAIVTIEEVLAGWYTLIRRSRDDVQLARAYRWLQESVEFFQSIRILGFTDAAIYIYGELRKKHRRAGKNDLRIAAIVLATGGTLVTRNSKDFEGISGLNLEDWSS